MFLGGDFRINWMDFYGTKLYRNYFHSKHGINVPEGTRDQMFIWRKSWLVKKNGHTPFKPQLYLSERDPSRLIGVISMLANFFQTLHTRKSCKTVNSDQTGIIMYICIIYIYIYVLIYIHISYQPKQCTILWTSFKLSILHQVRSSQNGSHLPTLGLGCPSMEAMSPPAKMLLSPWQPRAYNTGWRLESTTQALLGEF